MALLFVIKEHKASGYTVYGLCSIVLIGAKFVRPDKYNSYIKLCVEHYCKI